MSPRTSRSRSESWPARRRPRPAYQALDDLRIHHAAAVGDPAHSVQQCLDLADAVLDQIAAPCLLALDEAKGVGELQILREHEDADLGVLATDVLGGDEPLVRAGRRHADVDQGDVGAVALDLAIERFGIGGEARDVHAALAQHRGDAVAHDGRVVGDDHADGPAILALPLRGQHEMTPAQAAQLDLAALLEPDLLLEVGVGLGQLAHDPRDEHLAAVCQVGDPRRLDHRAPVQVVLERHRLAGVHPHPHAQVGRRGRAAARAGRRPRSAVRRWRWGRRAGGRRRAP